MKNEKPEKERQQGKKMNDKKKKKKTEQQQNNAKKFIFLNKIFNSPIGLLKLNKNLNQQNVIALS